MNPTEALYGFYEWLKYSKAKMDPIGGGHHSASILMELAKFVQANHLPPLEDGWHDHVKVRPN